jgi:hypothetical protein
MIERIAEKLKEWYFIVRFEHAMAESDRALRIACDRIRRLDDICRPSDTYEQDSSGYMCTNYADVERQLQKRVELRQEIREWEDRVNHWEKKRDLYRKKFEQSRSKQWERALSKRQ